MTVDPVDASSCKVFSLSLGVRGGASRADSCASFIVAFEATDVDLHLKVRPCSQLKTFVLVEKDLMWMQNTSNSL